MDLLIVVAIMGISTAVAMPLISAASASAESSVLLQNLRAIRGQIELYKVEHGGQAPLLHKGTFPQLTNSTNHQGVPGPPGKDYPHGPYLPAGVPANPYTGVTVVTPIDEFPPTAPSRVGGWLYHQETGRIAPDLAEYLSE
jgi:type II secretory pathway pseudopilin PulG